MDSIESSSISTASIGGGPRNAAHNFVIKHQFLSGFVFALLCLGYAFIIIGMVAGLEHVNLVPPSGHVAKIKSVQNNFMAGSGGAERSPMQIAVSGNNRIPASPFRDPVLRVYDQNNVIQ